MRECKPQSSLIVARLAGEDLPVHEGGEEVFLFRFMHPPLLVPWSEIMVRRKKGWVFEYVIFTMGQELAIPLQIRGKLAAKLRESAGNCWPIEET
jgi:hypothetical protein